MCILLCHMTCHMVLCVGPIKVITCFYLKLILFYIGSVPDEDLRVETLLLLLINSTGAAFFSVRTSLLLFRLSYLVVLHLSLIWVFGMCTPVWYFWLYRLYPFLNLLCKQTKPNLTQLVLIIYYLKDFHMQNIFWLSYQQCRIAITWG